MSNPNYFGGSHSCLQQLHEIAYKSVYFPQTVSTYHSNWASRKQLWCQSWGVAHVQTQLSHHLVLEHSADRFWGLLFLAAQNTAMEYNLGKNNKECQSIVDIFRKYFSTVQYIRITKAVYGHTNGSVILANANMLTFVM